jgi:uncharacterized protein with ATP-grasp and redox domains
MMTSKYPTIPIPEPLRGCELGTFTHSSVVERLPEIAERTIAENDFSLDVISKIRAMIDEIPDGAMRLLDDPQAPDSEEWHSYVSDFLGQNWLEVPWFFVEFYFYRRILEATGYFYAGETSFEVDPFNRQKRRGLESAQRQISELASLVGEMIQTGVWEGEQIDQLLKNGLWGNQADLSMWPVDVKGGGERLQQEALQGRILADHTDKIVEHIKGLTATRARIDLVLDNAGFELVTDLLFTDYLLASNSTHTLCLHPKAYPIFVSDVIPPDLDWTFDHLGASGNQALQASVKRLRKHRQDGRLRVCEDVFWTSPLSMWEMPATLRTELANSDLVVFKGDMNYRRLLGDRHWGYEVPFEDIMGYFPAPVMRPRRRILSGW